MSHCHHLQRKMLEQYAIRPTGLEGGSLGFLRGQTVYVAPNLSIATHTVAVLCIESTISA